MLGLVATYLLVSRLADRVAAALSVLVLATMPLYFVHARTMLGDGVTMASVAIAVSGLALALFDHGTVSRARRVLRASVCSGSSREASREGCCSVSRFRLSGWVSASPLVRLAGAVLARARRGGVFARRSRRRRGGHRPRAPRAPPRARRARALLRVARLRLLAADHRADVRRRRPPARARLVSVERALAARARALRAVRACGRRVPAPAVGLRATLVMVVAVGVTAWGGLAPFTGVLPFGAVAPLAVVVALALRDFDLGAPASRTFGMFAGALAILLLFDFRNFPEEMLGVFGLGALKFPESFRDVGAKLLAAGTFGSAIVLFFATEERARDDAPAFHRARVRRLVQDPARSLERKPALRAARGRSSDARLSRLRRARSARRRARALRHARGSRALARRVGLSGAAGFAVLVPVALMAVRDAFRLVDRARGEPALARRDPSAGHARDAAGPLASAPR